MYVPVNGNTATTCLKARRSAEGATVYLLHQMVDSLEKAVWMLNSENRKL
jgi:hypothetical protein